MMVQDEAGHKAAGEGWFESPATAQEALKRLAQSQLSELLPLSGNLRLMDALYKIRYEAAKGPEQWRIIREYLENFPESAFKSTWAEKPISMIPNVESWRQSLPAADQQAHPVSVGGEETLPNTARAAAVPQRTRRTPSVSQKLESPGDFPTLDIHETMQVLSGLSRSTIYRWADEGILKRSSTGKTSGKRSKVLFKTESVKKILEESSE